MFVNNLQDSIPLSARPYTDCFPAFYTNPFICELADQERWTVSDANKKPIDIKTFEFERQIYGVTARNSTCLATLPHSLSIVPNAPNHALLLDVQLDGYVCLDIEPSCPDDMKQAFLSLPYIYGETSMSGKGYHLIFKAPDTIQDYPDAIQKQSMKHKSKYYEILLHQFVTLTRNALPPATGTADFATIFNDLAAEQQLVSSRDVDLQLIDTDSIPDFDYIVNRLMQIGKFKTPDDFNGDMSTWEFGVAGKIKVYMLRILDAKTQINKHEYTDDEKVTILYTVVKEKLPYRSKHDSPPRDGKVWLHYLVAAVLNREDTPTNTKGDFDD